MARLAKRLEDYGDKPKLNENEKRKISFFVQGIIALIIILLFLGFILIPDLFRTLMQWLG